MKKIFLILLGVLCLAGCSKSYGVAEVIDCTETPISKTCSINLLKNEPNFAESNKKIKPEDRKKLLFDTAEGILLIFGWEHAEKCGYDTAILTKEEKESYVKNGIKLFIEKFDKISDFLLRQLISETLAEYYVSNDDLKKSLFWAHRGAENGSPNCMYTLALCYKSGFGVVRNPEEFTKWMYLGAAVGHEQCKNWVENDINLMSNKYTAPILKEGRQRAYQWMNDHPYIFITSE